MLEEYQNFSLLDFQKAFPDEESCLKYLFEMRWGNGYQCPKCDHNEYYEIKTRKKYQCKKCYHQTSLTAGTIFHKTRTPLQKWFWAIFLLSQHKSGISAMEIMRTLDLSRYETAWLITHKIREAMIKRDDKYNLKDNIELDDTYFGGKSSGKRGRGSKNKKIVIVGVEVDSKKSIRSQAKVIDNIKTFSINEFAKTKIQKGSKIITDGYKSYQFKESEYNHIPRVQKKKENNNCLDKVHLWVSNCKRFLQGTYKTESMKHLDRFISEFNWRFNRRWKTRISFWRLLRSCILTKTITYADLTG